MRSIRKSANFKSLLVPKVYTNQNDSYEMKQLKMNNSLLISKSIKNIRILLWLGFFVARLHLLSQHGIQ
jgi:hypothetical protein